MTKNLQLVNHDGLTAVEQQFIEALKEGKRALERAGALLVQCLDADKTSKARLAAKGNVSITTLNFFERLGRRTLYCEVFLCDAPCALALTYLPYSDQVKCMNEPVELLVGDNGNFDVLKVDVRKLTQEQVRQVFTRSHVRDLAEQRAWLAGQSRKAKTVNLTPTNYRIRGDAVDFLLGNAKLHVTRAELLRIAAEMDA